jgi:hypothetical protein
MNQAKKIPYANTNFNKVNEFLLNSLSNRDRQNFVEKDLKILLLLLFYETKYYIPLSEFENSADYSDIYLQRGNVYDGIKYEWVFELKYIKTSDEKKSKIISAKQKESIEQLQRYKTSIFFKDKLDVRFLSVVFVGKKKVLVNQI